MMTHPVALDFAQEPTLEGQGGPVGTFAALAAFYDSTGAFSTCGLDLGWAHPNATAGPKAVDNRQGCGAGASSAGG